MNNTYASKIWNEKNIKIQMEHKWKEMKNRGNKNDIQKIFCII